MDIFDILRKLRSGDNRSDAFIDAVLPEVAKWFTRLLASDPTTTTGEINALVLQLYRASPDAAQFFVRYMANLALEHLQTKWPKAAIPVMVFVKGYFVALEEASRAARPKNEREMADLLASLARRASDMRDELAQHFNEAVTAAQKVSFLHFPSVDLTSALALLTSTHSGSDPDQEATMAAKNGLSDKLGDLFSTIKEESGVGMKSASMFLNLTEDHVQTLATIITRLHALLLTLIVIVALIARKSVEGMESNGYEMTFWVASIVSMFAPLFAFLFWWWGYARNAPADTSANPNERAGNGLLKLAGITLTVIATGIVSSFIVMAMSILGIFLSEVDSAETFAWMYVWMTIVATGVMYATSIIMDLMGDGLKGAVKMVLPKGIEPKWTNVTTSVVRQAVLTFVTTAMLLLMPAVTIGLWFNTPAPMACVSLPAIVAIVTGLFGYTRMKLGSGYVADDLAPAHIKNRERMFDMANKLSTGWGIMMFIVMLIMYLAFPAPVAQGEPIPSLANRYAASAMGKAMVDIQVASDECTEEVKVVAKANQRLADDCTLAFFGTEEERAAFSRENLNLCGEAVKCEAITLHAGGGGHSSRGGWPDVPWGWIIVGSVGLVFGILFVVGLFDKSGKKSEGGGHAKPAPAKH